jgi:hypothetical protein
MTDRVVTFGVSDGIIATWLGTGQYGDVIDLPHIQMINATTRVLSAEGTGDNKIVALGAIVLAGTVQVRMTAVPLNVLEIVYGVDLVTLGVDLTLIETLPIMAGQRLPYWGICGLGEEAEGLGGMIMAANKAKITSDISLGTMEYGVLSSIEFTATCLGEDDYPIFYLQHLANIVDLTLDLPLPDVTAP